MKLTIIAHTNSKNPRMEKDLQDFLHVYVKEPAKEGKVNKAIIKALSKFYKVPTSKIELLHGMKNKNKTFDITTD